MIACSSLPRRRLSCLVLLAATSFIAIATQMPARADMAAAQAAITAGNFPAAGAALAPLATGGDANAQYQLAALALDGHPVGLPMDRAMSLLVQAAAQGNSHAQARLGMEYAQGDHVALNNLAAYTWLSRASSAADLTDDERARVTALRQDILDKIAPQAQYKAPDPGTSKPVSTKQSIPAAEKASAAPVNSVASVPLFSDPPLPSATNDNSDTAAAATADKSGKDNKTDPAGKAIETASKPGSNVQKPVKAAAAATDSTPQALSTAASGQAYFVQMASLPNETAATAEADRLSKKYAALLQGVSVSVHRADLGAKGFTQRVVAGPFDSLNTAKDRCLQLAAHNQDCRVVKMAN